MSDRQSRAQRMAKPALACVKSAAASNLAKDYKPRAMAFPTMVLQSGLAQAVGFLAAKSGKDGKGKAYQQYFDDLAKVAGLPNSEALLQEALRADLPRYRLLTRDVLDAASWLKRFCQSLINDEGSRNGD
ncbi:type III-B CRISPR module-associated protein Cmr5 [Thermomonas fusca]